MQRDGSIIRWSGIPMSSPTPQVRREDIDRFIDGTKDALGGILAVNAFIRAYPAFFYALQVETSWEWGDMQALIEDAHTAGALNAQQYAAFKQLATAHNIPI